MPIYPVLRWLVRAAVHERGDERVDVGKVKDRERLGEIGGVAAQQAQRDLVEVGVRGLAAVAVRIEFDPDGPRSPILVPVVVQASACYSLDFNVSPAEAT